VLQCRQNGHLSCHVVRVVDGASGEVIKRPIGGGLKKSDYGEIIAKFVRVESDLFFRKGGNVRATFFCKSFNRLRFFNKTISINVSILSAKI